RKINMRNGNSHIHFILLAEDIIKNIGHGFTQNTDVVKICEIAELFGSAPQPWRFVGVVVFISGYPELNTALNTLILVFKFWHDELQVIFLMHLLLLVGIQGDY